MEFRDVARVAAAQHGVVARDRLIEHGVSRSKLQRWLVDGRLEAVQRGVYRVAGAPVTWEQRLLAAVLGSGPGAIASHRAAARLWDIHGADVLDVTSGTRRGRRLAGAVLHFSGHLDGARRLRRNGIPATDPMRTLVDLGAVVTADALEDALDRALERRLVTVLGVERALEGVARSGRSGVGALRNTLNERALGRARPDSLLEPRMARLLRACRLPPAAFQHVVHHEGRFVGRIDFAYPHLLIAIEVDGFASHSSPSALQGDLDRQNALVSLGWKVIRFTWHDVVRRPAKVASAVRAMIATSSHGTGA